MGTGRGRNVDPSTYTGYLARRRMEARLPDREGLLGGSPYADPREVEHPLTPLVTLEVEKLAWVQPRHMHPAYELWGDERVVASIRFRDLQRREALAASSSGVWIITDEVRGRDVFAMRSGASVEAVFRRGPQNDGALFILDDRVLAWQRLSVWNRVFAFADEYGAEKMRFEVEQHDDGRTLVSFPATTRFDPDASLLAIAGQYLILAQRHGIATQSSPNAT